MDKKEIKHIQLSNQLQETKSQIKSIIESIDVGTWERNVQTGEITFSKRWAQMTGYDLSESGSISNKILEEITHPDDFYESNKLIDQHLAGELPYYKYESRIKHKNGNWVWVCERGGIISRTDDGRPLLMFGTHTDITKKKQTEQALENYIHIMNHDLKSPITTVLGYSSFLLEDENLTKEEIKKYSTIINKTGKKMAKMIDSYLSLAKIERGQDILGKKSMKIKELVDEISKNFLGLMDKRKINIVFENPNERKMDDNLMKKNVLIDEILIYSVVNNLIHNAIDASLNQEDEINVNIYESNNMLHLGFFNKGEISKEVQKKLFKKFISTKKNGTGIGLYSARLIARAHDGDVLYEGVKDGTRFVLQIPFS